MRQLIILVSILLACSHCVLINIPDVELLCQDGDYNQANELQFGLCEVLGKADFHFYAGPTADVELEVSHLFPFDIGMY